MQHRGALRVKFLLYLLSFVFVRHVRATVNANIKYDRVTLIKLRESTQNLLFHLSILDSFLDLFRDVGATPGQVRAGTFPDNLNPMRKAPGGEEPSSWFAEED